MDNYSRILKEIQRISSSRDVWEEDDFYWEVVRKIFIKKMGYETEDSNREECNNTFRVQNLWIKGSVDDGIEKELSGFPAQIKEKGCEWGILIRPSGLWLVNSEIKTNSSSQFTNSKIVLEIIYGMNVDQKYFGYFSKKNTIGSKKNAYFFRDIIDYKNNYYKGTEKSWPAYFSALKRYFSFIAEYKSDYGSVENVYDNIEYLYFVEFIRRETKCKSMISARNAFFYIKDFMQLKSKRGEFDEPERIKKSFPEFLPKTDMQNIMRIDKLEAAFKFLGKNRNGIRNQTMLLFLLSYGTERRKLCALTWKSVRFEDRLLKIEGKIYPMPSYLIEMLEELYDERMSKEYIFCNQNGEALSEGAINNILSGVAKTDLKDGFYSQLTPANIRRCLAKYLLAHGYPLNNILYLMDIKGYKLESYISQKEIETVFWSTCEDPIICENGQHPMEAFLEKLKLSVEKCEVKRK